MSTALLSSKAKRCLSGADAAPRGAPILVVCVGESGRGLAGLEVKGMQDADGDVSQAAISAPN